MFLVLIYHFYHHHSQILNYDRRISLICKREFCFGIQPSSLSQARVWVGSGWVWGTPFQDGSGPSEVSAKFSRRVWHGESYKGDKGIGGKDPPLFGPKWIEIMFRYCGARIDGSPHSDPVPEYIWQQTLAGNRFPSLLWAHCYCPAHTAKSPQMAKFLLILLAQFLLINWPPKIKKYISENLTRSYDFAV